MCDGTGLITMSSPDGPWITACRVCERCKDKDGPQ